MSNYADVLDFWQTASPEQWHAIGHRTRTLTPIYERLIDKGEALLGRSIGSVLDWGVGGGALAEILTPRGCKVYGADIVERSGAFSFVPIDIDRPEDTLADCPPVDLFACLTVIQHLPDRDYAERIIELSKSALVADGLVFLQARAGNAKDCEYRSRWSVSVAFRPDEFRHLVTAVGYTIRHEEFGSGATSGYQYLIGQMQ